jgi:hypothetical protein
VILHSYYNEEWHPLEERKDSETTASASYLWGSRHRDDLVRRDRAVGGTTLNETRYILMDYFSPASITDWAKSAFSERNPYPGWIASALEASAAAMMAPMLAPMRGRLKKFVLEWLTSLVAWI